MPPLGGKAKKTKSEITPWSGAVPFLQGKAATDGERGITGTLDLGYDLYNSSVDNPKFKELIERQQNEAQARLNNETNRANITTGALDVLGGALSPKISSVPTINATGGLVTTNNTTNASPAALREMAAVKARQAARVRFNNVTAGKVDGNAARSAFGDIDPTRALQDLLAADVNPHIDRIADTVTTNLTNNLRENVLPGVSSGSIASGQFGGSRQGIAEGLAMSRLNQDLATGITPMYASAFENAQARKSQAANALNNQAVSIATDNVNRKLGADQFNSTGQYNADTGNAQRQQAINQLNAQMAQQANQFNAGAANNMSQFNSNLITDMNKFNTTNKIDVGKFNANTTNDINKFNANLGLQNNNQTMAAAAQDVNTRLQGFNVLDRLRSHRDQDYATALGRSTQVDDRNWDLLNRYAGGIVQPAGGLGQSNVQTGSSGSNPFTGAIGGATSGAMLGSVVPGLGTGTGAILGGGLGLLGGIF